MPAARALRDVFTDLIGQDGGSGDAGEVLRASGHADLPDGLVAEAVVNFADTAPIEVAEHLAPYVAANSPVPALEAPQAGDTDEPLSWLEALTSAPIGAELDPGTDLDAAHLDAADPHQNQLDQAADPHAPDEGFSDFGIGDLDHDPTAGLDTAPGASHATEIHEAASLDADVEALGQSVDGAAAIDEIADEATADESPDQTPDDPFEA